MPSYLLLQILPAKYANNVVSTPSDLLPEFLQFLTNSVSTARAHSANPITDNPCVALNQSKTKP